MTPAAVLRELRRRCAEVVTDGDRIRWRPREAVDDSLRAKIIEAKPAILKLLAPDAEPSFAERIESGFVPIGWTPAAWRDRLCQLANRCERDHAERAADLRRWADNVPIRLGVEAAIDWRAAIAARAASDGLDVLAALRRFAVLVSELRAEHGDDAGRQAFRRIAGELYQRKPRRA